MAHAFCSLAISPARMTITGARGSQACATWYAANQGEASEALGDRAAVKTSADSGKLFGVTAANVVAAIRRPVGQISGSFSCRKGH